MKEKHLILFIFAVLALNRCSQKVELRRSLFSFQRNNSSQWKCFKRILVNGS